MIALVCNIARNHATGRYALSFIYVAQSVAGVLLAGAETAAAADKDNIFYIKIRPSKNK